MVVIGIDPGPVESALVMVQTDYTIDIAMKVPNADARQWLYGVLNLRSYQRSVAIEFLQCYGMPVGRSVFETCFWAGRFADVAESLGATVKLYGRPKIFSGVTGWRKGGDAAMRRALLTRFGGDKKGEPMNILKGGGSDKRSAFATAVYHMDGAKLGEL